MLPKTITINHICWVWLLWNAHCSPVNKTITNYVNWHYLLSWSYDNVASSAVINCHCSNVIQQKDSGIFTVLNYKLLPINRSWLSCNCSVFSTINYIFWCINLKIKVNVSLCFQVQLLNAHCTVVNHSWLQEIIQFLLAYSIKKHAN